MTDWTEGASDSAITARVDALLACFGSDVGAAFSKILQHPCVRNSRDASAAFLRCMGFALNPSELFSPPRQWFKLLKTIVEHQPVGFGAFVRDNAGPGSDLSDLACFLASICQPMLGLRRPPLLPASTHNRLARYFNVHREHGIARVPMIVQAPDTRTCAALPCDRLLPILTAPVRVILQRSTTTSRSPGASRWCRCGH